MRAHIAFSLVLAVAAAACGRSPSNQKTYPVQGQVLEVAQDHQQATVNAEEIKGFMAAMAMPYKVKDPQLLNGIVPGDLINATLVVDSDGAYFSAVKKVGEAPLAKPATATPSTVAPELKPGEAVPDADFVDQNGRKQAFNAFQGGPLAITFMHTNGPLPGIRSLIGPNLSPVH